MSSTLKDVSKLVKLFRQNKDELLFQVQTALYDLQKKCTLADARWREDTMTNLADLANVIDLLYKDSLGRISTEIRILAASTTVYQLRNSIAARSNLVTAINDVVTLTKSFMTVKEEV